MVVPELNGEVEDSLLVESVVWSTDVPVPLKEVLRQWSNAYVGKGAEGR